MAGSDPQEPDSDHDGTLDGDEIKLGRDPALLDYFTPDPSDDEFFARRVLWMPIGKAKASSAIERRALSNAITTWGRKTGLDVHNVEELEEFVWLFPEGAYRSWVEASICHEYYRAGRFTKALAAYRSFWPQFKDVEPVEADYQGWHRLMEAAEIEFAELALW